MADTGAPWNIPYVEPTDVVRDYPAADEAQALAVAAGLSAAGGLVAVKSVLKTNVFSSSVASGADVEVTDMTITHTMESSSNKLLLMANLTLASSTEVTNRVAPIFFDGTNLLGIGDAEGVRSRVATFTDTIFPGIPIMLLHSPEVDTALTYSVRLRNTDNTTRTFFVNRFGTDSDDIRFIRASSTFVLMEVKV